MFLTESGLTMAPPPTHTHTMGELWEYSDDKENEKKIKIRWK